MNKSLVNYIKFLLITAIVASCISCFVIPVAAKQSGTCGQSLKWTLDAGTLTITGSGAMTDYEEPELSPWYEYREQIIRIVFPDKLTNIGNLAFYGCTNLVSVVLPNTVKRIGHYAFAECISLCILNMGTGVTSIGRASFYGCESLVNVVFPYGLEQIGKQAFYKCSSIVSITVPQHVSEIEEAAFAHCANLQYADIQSQINIVETWLFYGCEKLSHISFSDEVTSVDKYAFAYCDRLTRVYYEGKHVEDIEKGIIEDVPSFEGMGMVTAGDIPSKIITSSTMVGNDSSNVTHIVDTNKNVVVHTIVEIIDKEENDAPAATPSTASKGTYVTDVSVVITQKEDWDVASDEIAKALKYVNDTYSVNGSCEKTNVDVYVQEGKLNTEFLTDMTGRDLTLNVTPADGSSWKVDCSELKQNTVIYDSNYSYTVKEGSKDNAKKLGTDKCYQLNFNEDAMMDAQVVVKLPSSETKDTNAFLYQIEKDGSYTRLQAVKVGDSGNVNLYLGAVKDNTQYVIGIDVPNERTDDIIIPDEIADKTNNAIARLEKIEYVITGLDSSWGMNMRTVTIILIIVLVGCAVIVGVIMGIMNKRKLKRMNVNYR